MEINELLKSTWKITRDHKILWVLGFLSIASAFLILPLLFVPGVFIFAADSLPSWLDSPLVWVGWGLAFLLVIVLNYALGSLTRAALILGVRKAEQGAKLLSFGGLLREAVPFFWRFLGMMLLYGLTILLVNGILSGIQIIGAVLTMGLATICLTPLSYLLYPLIYGGLVWMELAETAMVVEGLNLKNAIRRGWEVIRHNMLNLLVVALIMYLGIGFVAGAFMAPLLIPFFGLPFALIENRDAGIVLLISSLCVLMYLPVFIFIQGVTAVFMKAGWYLAYVRLTQKPVVPQAPASMEPEGSNA